MSRSRSKSSGRWLQEHANDSHVKQAALEGYRSRAVYKLKELDDKEQLLKPGSRVLELGAAPGGWTQYVSEKIGNDGTAVASDILPMDSMADVQFIQGDFREQVVADQIEAALGGKPADLVLSDMAPNLSGVASSDQARSMALAELALEMAISVLGPEGCFVAKVFQGEGFDQYMAQLRAQFDVVKVRKPSASRSRSREVYVVARKLI